MTSDQTILYAWHCRSAKTPAEARMFYQAAQVAFNQSLAMDVASPGAVYGVASLLGPSASALAVVRSALKANPQNPQFEQILESLQKLQQKMGQSTH